MGNKRKGIEIKLDDDPQEHTPLLRAVLFGVEESSHRRANRIHRLKPAIKVKMEEFRASCK
jgi:hypothetical protein